LKNSYFFFVEKVLFILWTR